MGLAARPPRSRRLSLTSSYQGRIMSNRSIFDVTSLHSPSGCRSRSSSRRQYSPRSSIMVARLPLRSWGTTAGSLDFLGEAGLRQAHLAEVEQRAVCQHHWCSRICCASATDTSGGLGLSGTAGSVPGGLLPRDGQRGLMVVQCGQPACFHSRQEPPSTQMRTIPETDNPSA